MLKYSIKIHYISKIYHTKENEASIKRLKTVMLQEVGIKARTSKRANES